MRPRAFLALVDSKITELKKDIHYPTKFGFRRIREIYPHIGSVGEDSIISHITHYAHLERVEHSEYVKRHANDFVIQKAFSDTLAEVWNIGVETFNLMSLDNAYATGPVDAYHPGGKEYFSRMENFRQIDAPCLSCWELDSGLPF